MFMEIVGIIVGVILLGAFDYGGYGGFNMRLLVYLIDFPSLIIILVFTAPVLFGNGMWKDFKRAFSLLRKKYTCHLSELKRTLDVVEMMQRQLIYAGIIGMLLSFIHLMRMLSDPASIGPNLSVAILTMFYALLLEMLLLPLQFEVKRRIIDYMEIDTDAESERAIAGKESGNSVVEKVCENVTTGKEKEKTVIVIEIENGKDVTVKEGEAAKKETEETAAGTEEEQV